MAPPSQATPAAPASAPSTFNRYKMTSALKNLYFRATTSSSSSTPTIPPRKPDGSFSKAPTAETLFPPTNPEEDGEECLHDCASCTVQYPRKFVIDEEERLFGHVKGWSTHLVVATGRSDWVRDVAGMFLCLFLLAYAIGIELN